MPRSKKVQRETAERKITLIIPDARDAAVRKRVALASARLSPADENDAMDWIESVSIMNERDGDER